MKNYRTIRNLWIFSGICFLLASIINYSTINSPNNNNKSYLGFALNVVTCMLMFINAYLNHKKINKDNRY